MTPGDVVRIRGERWRATAHASFGRCAIVDVIGIDATNQGTPARFLLPFEPAERIVVNTEPRVTRPQRWRRAAASVLATASPSPASLRTPASSQLDVMPFQLEPALAVTHGRASRLLIADAVGLGKTIQAGVVISEVLARVPEGHALVICPAGLREQWLRELQSRFATDARIVESTAAARTPSRANPWTTQAVAVASIDYVKRPDVIRGLEEVVWDVVVFDEAHWLAGRSDRATAAFEVAARARVVVALTATPHAGDDAAFARLCDLGRLDDEGPIAFFRRTRRDAGVSSSRRMRLLHVRPTFAERRMHDALTTYARAVWKANLSAGARLAMTVLARRACSSAHALAISIERRLAFLRLATSSSTQLRLPLDAAASDEEPDVELGAPGLQDESRERRHLEHLLHLTRSASDESKLHRIRRLLARADEPVIVFTEYRDTLEHLSRALAAYDCVCLHGGMTMVERREAERAFCSGSARVLLATDAASEGLNLHHRCRFVINLEVPWTPVRLEQRVGRIDRIGQQRRVHAIHLIARDTAEDSVLRRLVEREWRARASLEGIANVDANAVAAAALNDDLVCLSPTLGAVDDSSRAATIDGREEAIAEALRIESARRLARVAGHETTVRPVVTVLSRRRPVTNGHWAYRLTAISDNEEWVWQAVVALSCSMHPMRVSHARHVRALAAALSRAFDKAIHVATQRATDELTKAIHPLAARGIARERAIQRRIETHRSTMAAALLQRGLFDTREERRASADAVRLTAAFERCEARLDLLHRLSRARLGGAQLAFAVLSR